MDNTRTVYLLALFLAAQVYLISGRCEDSALGLANRNVLDSEIAASSVRDSLTPAKNGRLNYTAGNSWCAATSDSSPYLQIDLHVRHIICAVSTQGNSKEDNWVETYKLKSSNDGTTWTNYQENKKIKIFIGNFDRQTTVKHMLLNGIVARYLRFIPQVNHGDACLRVELYGLPTNQVNLALYKPTTQSTTDGKYVSSNAVDGNRATEVAKCTHTTGYRSTDPWWRVDLGQVEHVSGLYIVNRNSNGDRLNGAEIRVGNVTTGGGASDHLCRSGLSVPQGQGKLFRCKPAALGRYVFIRIPGDGKILTLCEVEVYSAISNLALQQPASQSSIYPGSGGVADRAVDGKALTGWGQNSCTLTKTETDPWWRVDLGSSLPVAEVFIVNRACDGGCGDRFKGFEIRIGNDGQNGGVSNPSCGGLHDLTSGEKKSFYCDPRLMGQFVFIRIPGNGKTLTICELEVYSRKRNSKGDPPACTGEPVRISDDLIIPDYRFIGSSSRSGNEPSKGRLRGSSAWVPRTNNDANDFLQIDLGSVYFVCGVATQGNPLADEWTTTYKIKTSLNNQNWTTYVEDYVEKSFIGNNGKSSIVKSVLHQPPLAKFVRLYPESYNAQKALRVEVYGAHAGCQSSLGLEDKSLLDSQIRTSSVADSSHGTSSSRLYSGSSWCSLTASTSEYLQVDIGHVKTVTGVATQGDPSSNKWVTSFMVQFGHQDNKWLKEMILQGNIGNKDVFVTWFTESVEARFIRIAPLTWKTSVCMRMDLYGCDQLLQVLPPTSNGPKDQQLQAVKGAFVELTCNVSGMMQTRIRWENNGHDITRLSSGLSVQGNSVTSTLKVNFTTVENTASTYNCTRESIGTRTLNCRNTFTCLALYSSLAGGEPIQQKADITTQLEVPAAIQTITADSIQGNSAIIRWKQPSVGGTGEGAIIGYELEVTQGGVQTFVNVSATPMIHTLKTLQRNTKYKVNIRAISTVGKGLWSSSSAIFKTARTVNCEETLLGMEAGFYPDMIVSSTKYNISTPASNAALMETVGLPWCSSDSDSSPYLRIDLGNVYVICALSTQGNSLGDQWVETYQLRSTFDGTAWTDYKEGGQPRVFLGNYDSSSIVKHELYSGLVCRKLQLVVKLYSGLACLKLQLFGIKEDIANLALNKPTSQSTTNLPYVSSNAVDGKRATQISKCSHTTGYGSTDPWWRVDLGLVESVSELYIVNRGDCCGNRLNGFEIRVGNVTTGGGTSNHLCGNGLIVPQGQGKFFQCKPAARGRYVYIRLPGSHKFLALCEVEVYSTIRSNLALQRPASQSSTYPGSGGVADRAVDGKTSTNWNDKGCSLTNTETNPWWRVDLGSSLPVAEVFIVNRACGVGCGDRFKGFQIRIGNDDRNGGISNPSCGGVYDLTSGQRKSFYCEPRLMGQFVFIRISGNSKTLTICECEVYSRRRIAKACTSEPVGITNNSTIPDYRFTGSSSRSGNEPSKGRLGGSSAWVPSTNNDANDFLQIDLGSVYFVCGVATQGNPSANEWTKTYNIKTSLNNANWTTYAMIFDGNNDRSTLRRNTLTASPVAKFIRFYPIQYNSSKSLRVEVYGYAQGSKSPVGLENSDVVNAQITASSNVASAVNGRLYDSSSWCSSTALSSEYLQVDLGLVKTVTGVATQGDPSSDKWVTKYAISFSYRPGKWIVFKGHSNQVKTLTGNDDRNSVQVNWMEYPFVARYLRFYPQSWSSSICLRVDGYASSHVNVPIIRPALVNKTLQKSVGSTVMLSCSVLGIPHVIVTWDNNGVDITNSSGVTLAVSVENTWEKTETNLTLSYSNASYAKSQFKCSRVSQESRILKCQARRLTCSAQYSGTLLQASSTASVNLADDLFLPAAPLQPVISNITSTDVTVTWNSPDAGDSDIMAYRLSYSTSKDSQHTAVNITAVGTSAVISPLQPYTVYSVKVQAVSEIGHGVLSVQETFQTYLQASIFIAPPHVYRLFLGQRNVSFVCYGQGYPMPTIVWKKDGNLIVYTTISTNLTAINSSKRLEIRPEGVTYEEAGNYTCEVYNGVDGKSKVFRELEVLFVPEFRITPNDTIVLEGESLILSCEASGVPAPNITWSLDGSSALPPGSKQLTNGSLVIPDVRNTAKYEGVYNCTASSKAGFEIVQARLTVWVAPIFSYTSQRNSTLLAGEVLNLTCVVTGDPEPIITWRKNGLQEIPGAQLQPNNSTLIIPNVSISDEAVYVCVAKNDAGATSANFSVIVQEPAVVGVPGPSVLKLHVGDKNVSVECNGRGKPYPNITWTKDGETIPITTSWQEDRVVQVISKTSDVWNVTSLLYLRTGGVTYEEAGNYTCEVYNGVDKNVPVQRTIRVLFRPEFVEKPDNVTIVVQGNDVIFPCNASGIPKPTIVWRFNSGNLPPSEQDDGILQVFSVQNNQSYEGVYTCNATNVVGSIKSDVKLIVDVPARLIVPLQNKVLIVGSALNLTCPVIGDPFPGVSWTKDGWHNISRANLTQRNTTLEILNANIDDEGMYECRVVNRAGNDSSNATVVVNALSDVFVPQPHLIKLNRGEQNISIECHGYGKPTPTVLWKKAGETIPVISSFNTTYSKDVVQVISKNHSSPWNVSTRLYLRVDGLTYAESGEYVCEVQNTAAGNSSARQSVEIVFLPEFDVKPKSKIGLVDSNVTFFCNASGVPKPDITWSFDGGRLPQFASTDNDTLTVFVVQNTDAFEGNYTCNASNRAGYELTSAKLTVDVPPRITPLQSLSLIINSNLNLTCSVYGDPVPVVYWMKNGTSIIPKSQLLYDNRTLLINDVDIDVDGTYTCVAVNRAGNSFSSADVVVLIKPEIFVAPPHIIKLTRQQNNITVDCYAYGKPTPAVKWLKNGVEIPTVQVPEKSNNSLRVFQVINSDSPSSIWNVSSRLFIAPGGVSYKEAGVYTCEVYNGAGRNVTLNETIEVLFRPEIVVLPKKQVVLEGHNASFQCYAIGIPRPTVMWIHQTGPLANFTSQSVANDNRTTNNTLAIYMVKNNNLYEGNYTCNASSIAGVEVRTAEMVVDVPPMVVLPLKYTSLLANSKLNLTCEVEGDPVPSITWLKDESDDIPRAVFLRGNRTLVVYAVQIEDGGRYKCVLQSRAGNATSEAFVEIKVPPQISLSHEVLKLRRNDRNVTVDCYGYGKPLPVVSWSRESKTIPRVAVLLSNDSSEVVQTSFNTSEAPWNVTARLYLRTDGITYNDAGTYSCEVNNGVGTRGSVNDTTEVLFIPEFIKEPSDQVVLEGSNVTFVCNASGVPKPFLSWTFKSGSLPSSSEAREGTLTVSMVRNTQDFEGNYTCSASNRAGISNTTAKLTVDVPGKITSLPKNVTLVSGSNLNLTCVVIGDPAPSVYWMKNGSSVIGRGELYHGNTTLIIRSVRIEDEGVYKCVVKNRAGNDSFESVVEVKAHARVFISPPNELSLLKDAQNITVDCYGYGKPTPTVRWTRNSTDVLKVNKLTDEYKDEVVQVVFAPSDDFPWNTSSRLYLRTGGVTYKDAGNYTCEVFNGVGGSLSAKATVQVFFRPQFVNRPNDQVVIEYQNATFPCNASGVPEPTITWLFSGGSLPAHTTKDGSLTVFSVKNNVKYEGNYTCTASNRAGLDQDTAQLTVNVPPQIIKRLNETVVAERGDTVVLTCLADGDPRPHYYWTKDGSMEFLNATFDDFNRTLRLTNVDSSNDGVYTCVAENDAGINTTSSNVTIHARPSLIKNFPKTTVTEGDSISLTCSGESIPHSTVTWLKENQTVRSDGHFLITTTGHFTRATNLTIVSVKYEDHGIYTCLFSNYRGTVNGTGRLIVNVEANIFVEGNKTLILERGQPNVTIDCYGKGHPAPEVLWSTLHKPVTIVTEFSNNDTLRVVQIVSDEIKRPMENVSSRLYLRTAGVTYEEAGNYSCTANNTVGKEPASTGIEVLFKPEFDVTPRNQTVKEGEAVMFWCKASGVPEPVVTWIFSGGDLPPNSQANNSLIILTVKNNANYEGTYSCVAKSRAGAISFDVVLTVHVPPQIIKSLNDSVVAERHDTVVLTCLADGDPRPHYYWTKDGSMVFSNAQFDDFNKTLRLTNVDSKNDGVYTCVAENDAGINTTSSNVTIHARPSLIKSFPKTTVTEGDNISLTCSGESIPPSTVTWLKENQTVRSYEHFLITTSGHFTRTTNLTIVSVKYEDHGIYTCLFSNYRGTVNGTGRLIVNVPATIVQPPVSVKRKIGLSVTLNCTVKGFPPPSLIWMNDGVTLDETERIITSISGPVNSIEHVTSLTFLELIRKDTGTYWCNASNIAGASLRAANLTVLEKPDKLDLFVVSTTSRAVEIKWTVLFDGNSPVLQFFITHNTSNGNVTFNTSASEQRYSISRLKPATSYVFWVTATNQIGTSIPAVAYSTTLEAEPEAPQHLRAISINSTAIFANWTRPVITNGILTKYVLYHDRTEVSTSHGILRLNVTLWPNTTWLLIEGLDPFTNYTVQVQAFTIIGGGNRSEPFGPVLTHQDVPEAPHDVRVEEQSDAETFVIRWEPPLKPNGVITGYKIFLVIESENPTKAENKIFENEDSSTVKLIRLQELNGDKRYNVIVQGKTKKGFGRNSTEKAFVETPATAPPEPSKPPSSYENDTTATTAVIELVKFSSINGKIWYYQVIIVIVPKGTNGGIPEPKDIKPKDVLSYEHAHKSAQPASYLAIQFMGEDFETYRIFTIGNEKIYKCCRVRREVEEYFNGPLQPNSEYRAFTRAFTSQTSYSQSQYAKISTKVAVSPGAKPSPTPPSASGVIAGVVVAVLLVVIAAVIFIYIRRKRRAAPEDAEEAELQPLPRETESKEGSLNEGFTSADECLPIPVGNLKEHYIRMHADDDRLFSEEYKAIQISGSPTTDVCDLPENKVKNRYGNIKAYDHSRVTLNREGASDYINANYIDGYNCPQEYIATIGPKPETANDFWWMVWQEKTSVIVMLTRPIENGKRKCHKYWPDQGSEDYGPLTVRVKQSEELADFEIRTLSLSMPSQTKLKPRMVTHFYFTAWPDHDVPDHATGLLQFWKRVRKVATDKSPMVVHCSAGVGRTGTFIVIDAMMKQIAASGELDIYNYVTNMREQRNIMVQKLSQYTFLHYALLEATTFGDTEIAVQDLRIKMKELGKKDPKTHHNSFEREFSFLDGVIPEENLDFTTALKAENAEKNRYANVLPYERNRVFLPGASSEAEPAYINASLLEGFRERKAYIATQAPLLNTTGDFWRMVWEHDVHSIVMLMSQKEGLEDPLVAYWSEKETVCHGSLTVETTDVDTNEDWIVREISLTETKTSETRKITHFEFLNWPKDGVPQASSSVLNLISALQKVQQQTGNHPTVVHCSDGIGRTGSFCALKTCLEEVKLENTFDVFTSVRMLRTQRPGMVQTLVQYKFIYDAIVAYLDSFESALYQNFL